MGWPTSAFVWVLKRCIVAMALPFARRGPHARPAMYDEDAQEDDEAHCYAGAAGATSAAARCTCSLCLEVILSPGSY